MTALPWLVSTIVVIAAGGLSEGMLRSGVSSRYARFYLGALCVLTGGLLVTAAPFAPSSDLKLAMLVGGISLPVVVLSLIPQIISEYVPAGQRSGMLAIGQAIVTFAGVLAPAITGHIADQSAGAAGYEHGFTVCGIIIVCAAVIGTMVIGPRPRPALA
jgi:MFS family permease